MKRNTLVVLRASLTGKKTCRAGMHRCEAGRPTRGRLNYLFVYLAALTYWHLEQKLRASVRDSTETR